MTLTEIIGTAAGGATAIAGAAAWLGRKIAATARADAERLAEVQAVRVAIDEHAIAAAVTAQRIEARMDRVEQKVDRLSSDLGSKLQVVAAHDATIEQHGERIVRMESRQSPPPMLGRK